MRAHTREQHREEKDRYKGWAQVPFAAAFGIGIAIMALLKHQSFHQLAVTLAGVAVMIAYAVLVARITILRIRDDQRGDNCYYLGFLFTLVSLSHALWRFSGANGIEEIVANFGLALGTTIAGILLRVMINQERRDILETEKDSRIALATAVRDMRVSIEDATSALDAFCHQTRQIASEHIQATATEVAGVLGDAISKVGDASTRTLNRVEEAFAEFKGHASKLNKASGQTVKALEALFSKIEAIDAPSDLVSKRLEPALAASEEVARRLQERLTHDERAIEAAAKRATAIEQELKAAAVGISDTSSVVAKVGASVAQAADAAERAALRIASLSAGIEEGLTLQTKAAEDARAATRLMLEQLVAEHREIAQRAAETFGAVADAIGTSNIAMAAEVERARRMSADLGDALAGLAKALGDRAA